MKTEVKLLKLSQNGLIQCFKWLDDTQEEYKGIVLISHGQGEHIERYIGFVEKLTSDGFIVYGHNQRGHKNSIESYDDYGYMSDEDNFQILVSDLYSIYDIIKAEHPELPLFVFGHSMGSFVVQRFIQLHGKYVDGIILSGSCKPPRATLEGGIIMSKLICKFKGRRYRSNLLNNLTFKAYNNFFKPTRTDFDWLNRDESEVDKYVSDPYCGGIFTAAYYRDFFKGLKTINQNYELVPKNLPMLLISGSQDPVGGMRKYILNLYKTYKHIGIKDININLYNNARHEILLETNKEEVMMHCLTWLNDHLQSPLGNT